MRDSATEMLSAHNLSYSTAVRGERFPILANITITLHSGQITAFLGPNGCGKTTLLRILAGLLPSTGGQVCRATSCASIGLVFQNVYSNLLPWRSVLDNIALPGLLKGDQEAKRQAKEMLDRLDLSWASSRLPGELSGGQQQVVSLARWLANPPDLLLIDEGWSMLDITQRQRMYSLLKEIASMSVAIGIVTHSMSDLAALVDSVFVFVSRPASVHSHIIFRADQNFEARNEELWGTLRKVFALG